MSWASDPPCIHKKIDLDSLFTQCFCPLILTNRCSIIGDCLICPGEISSSSLGDKHQDNSLRPTDAVMHRSGVTFADNRPPSLDPSNLRSSQGGSLGGIISDLSSIEDSSIRLKYHRFSGIYDVSGARPRLLVKKKPKIYRS